MRKIYVYTSGKDIDTFDIFVMDENENLAYDVKELKQDELDSEIMSYIRTNVQFNKIFDYEIIIVDGKI